MTKKAASKKTTTAKKTPATKAPRKGTHPVHVRADRLNRIRSRLVAMMAVLKPYIGTEEAVDMIETVVGRLKTAADLLAKVDPKRAAAPAKKEAASTPKAPTAKGEIIIIGAAVNIRASKRAEYTELLGSADQLDGIRVLTVKAGGKLGCVTRAGEEVSIPKKHLELAPAAPTQTVEAQPTT